MTYLVERPLIEHAIAYARRGFAVFPCHSISDGVCTCGNAPCLDIAKHPLTAHGVKDATTDTEWLTPRFTGDYAIANIAMATGELSGVVVVDVDDVKALERLEAAYGSLPQTWQVETGSGGRHYYFACDERCASLKNAVKFAGALDVRTTGGYVLLPPSLHASGQRYRWVVSPDACAIASLPDWLLNLIPQKPTQTANFAAPVESEQSVEPTSSTSHTMTVQRATTLAERASLYLAHVTPAISGQDGHAHTYGVVCRLVELFGLLTDDELLDALQTWNASCVPSWSDGELRHKIADARAKVTQQTDDDLTSCDSASDDAFPSLDAAAYVGLLGDIVRTIEPHTEADPAGVLLTLLCCLGNVIGKAPSFSVGGGTHHANLFVCLVGDTSAGKGQAWDVCDYLMRRVDPHWRNECLAFGLSSGEGLVERLADPIMEDQTADDITLLSFDAPEPSPSLTLTPSPERRLLCYESEFAKPITAMRREGNTLSPLLRSAWDTQTLEVLTRGKSRLRASNAYVSILAHVTEGELRKLLSQSVETTNGFANRFLWGNVRDTKDLPSGGDVSVLDRYVEPLRKAIDAAQAIGAMSRTPEAEALWEGVYASLKRSPIRATERGRPQVLRLAMLYALCDSDPTINTTHLNAALSVWRYCEESALRFFDSDTLAIRLRDTIRQRPGIMRSELRHSISHNVDTSRFDSALRWLLRRGDVVSVPVYEDRQAERFYPGMGRRGRSDTSEPTSPTSHRFTIEEAASPEPTSPTSHAPTQTMTLAELLAWKNDHAVRFVRRDGGRVWVTNDKASLVTPAIEQAITDNQQTLEVFVGAYSGVTITDAGDDLTANETFSLFADADESWMDDLRTAPANVTLSYATPVVSDEEVASWWERWKNRKTTTKAKRNSWRKKGR